MLKPPMAVIFKSGWILLKICILSNLMVLSSFFMLFWPGGILTIKNVETPYDSDFIKVVGFGWKIAVCVIWWCWIQFLFILFIFLYYFYVFFTLAAAERPQHCALVTIFCRQCAQKWSNFDVWWLVRSVWARSLTFLQKKFWPSIFASFRG